MSDHISLTELELSAPFSDRHIGTGPADQATMLAAVGHSSLEALCAAAVPGSIADSSPLRLPAAVDESTVLAELRALADRNRTPTSMIGLGYADTVTPPVIRRNIFEDPSWYTAYTPYQPEISQGRLEALLNFQTVVSELSGLSTANASLLDEATAAAEAVALARRTSRAPQDAPVVLDADCLPQTIAVIRTRAVPMGIPVVVRDLAAEGLPDGPLTGLLLQYPGASGVVRDLTAVTAEAKERGAVVAVAADLLALTLLRPPGEWGADVVVGSAQRFGVPLGFGGPHAGYMVVREGLARQLPGRLVGVSRDADGAPAYRLALQTREQHIRRERATSNICTAQVLLAVMASSYAVYHGPDGLRAIARRVHRYAAVLAAGLTEAGVEVVHGAFFDTVLARVPGRADEVVAAAAACGVNLRRADADHVSVACDEVTRRAHLAAVWAAFGIGRPEPDATDRREAAGGHDAAAGGDATGGEHAAGGEHGVDRLDPVTPDALPAGLRRESQFLTHPVFSTHHSETAMLRYLRRLSDLDYALDRGMIPLGSCTMKLNATAEMEPVSLPGFARVHPFAPAEQVPGYLELIGDLQRWLAEITGYDAVSLQPNAGSQGELSGLLAIHAYHAARGEGHRDVCLIPQSAHGTNAASAAMAGMRVVVVKARENGDVDLDDLRSKVDANADRLAALMVTYPSTHGVFETEIGEVCAAVHDAGGQVYVDGANLNALVGLAKPGHFGADVSHLNLHKTFCIPHGGGGPGVGPVAARAHLAPYLPNHPLQPLAGPATGPGPVSAAPWGSASILPISWAYVRLMGPDGLVHATRSAILAANYLAARLREHYPVLYTGSGGLVAHECIVDLRSITKQTGVTVDDVAKRLIDYGFHAPTMSFPVAGTLMIEPTESEDLAELDRFVEAMIAIRHEIDRVAVGEWDKVDNPLRNAPHTAAMVTSDKWERPYDRELAAYPGSVDPAGKYWPPVRRVDGAYGDRNLVCACPPIAAYED